MIHLDLNEYDIALIKIIGRLYKLPLSVADIENISMKYGLNTKIYSNEIIKIALKIHHSEDFNKIKNLTKNIKSYSIILTYDELYTALTSPIIGNIGALDTFLLKIKKEIPKIPFNILLSININFIGRSFRLADLFQNYVAKYYIPTIHDKTNLKLFKKWRSINSTLYDAIRKQYHKNSVTWEPKSNISHYTFGNPQKSPLTNFFLNYIIKQTKEGKKATRKDFLTKMNRPINKGYLSSFFAAIKDAEIVKLNPDNTYEIGPKYKLYKNKLLKRTNWKDDLNEVKIKSYLKEQMIKDDMDEFHKYFMKNYSYKYENINDIWEKIQMDLTKSPTTKIILTDNSNYCGLSLNNGVYLSKNIFHKNLGEFIYVLFHEIAHQYQYKKYGKNLFYHLATQNINETILDMIISIEKVADNFGRKKARLYGKLFNLPTNRIYSPYDNTFMAKQSYQKFIEDIQHQIKNDKIHCVEELENYLSNASLNSLG